MRSWFWWRVESILKAMYKKVGLTGIQQIGDASAMLVSVFDSVLADELWL